MRENLTYEEIVKVNESIRTTDIKGKEYAEVNQRIKAFRMLFPLGKILTEMVSNENGVCVFRCSVYNGEELLGTGHAYEKENSTFINKTSYIENCETSAVGRALGMCGIGIDTAVASYEEVANAIEQQKPQNKGEKQAKNERTNENNTKTNTKEQKQFRPMNEVQYKMITSLPEELQKFIVSKYELESIEELSGDRAGALIQSFVAKGILKNEEMDN